MKKKRLVSPRLIEQELFGFNGTGTSNFDDPITTMLTTISHPITKIVK